MPKKTKKEKLLAQRHRTNIPPVVTTQGSRTATAPSAVSLQYSLSASQQISRSDKTKSELPNEYQSIKRDIIKTVVVTSIILISEFLLTKWLPL